MRPTRSLLLLPIAAALLSGLIFTAAPAAGAAKSQPFLPYTGPVTRAGDGSEPAPKGPGATPPAARRAIPLRTPDPAALRRAKERAASRLPGGGGRSPQAPTPLPNAAVLGGLNKAGMNAAQSGGANTPPDTTGAIGPSHYVEFVNGTGITAYDRSDLSAEPGGPVALGEFIGREFDNVFDPQIQWDQHWGRWIYAMDDIVEVEPGVFEEGFLAFGWSKTDDPTKLSTAEGEGWCGYRIETEELFDDYPKLGHSNEGITIGTNVFDESAGGEFAGSRIWSIKKPTNPEECPALGSEFIASTPLPLETEDGHKAFTPVPANTADSSADSYVVAADSPFFVPEPEEIMAWHVSGAGETATLEEDGNMEVSPFAVPAPVPQPGTTTGELDSLDTRLTNAVAVKDPAVGEEAVWTQHTVDGPGEPSVVRWYELLPEAEPEPGEPEPVVRQEGTISNPSNFVFNAAISPTAQGDAAAIDFNVGGETLFPEMHARSRNAGTSLGQMGGDTLLGTSAGAAEDFSCNEFAPVGVCRWGDYAGASPDPVLPSVVWGSNQGLAAPNETPAAPNETPAARWTTRNFALSTAGAPAAPTITGTDPASPANDNEPKVQGNADAETRVRVYKSADCSGPIAGFGDAAEFASPGLTIVVGDNETVQLSAKAFDLLGTPSPCSNSISYTESTPPPSPSEETTTPPPPAAGAPPLPPIASTLPQPPRGTAVAKKVAFVKRGRALLRLTCRGAGRCRGSLRLVYRKKVRTRNGGKGNGANGSKRRVRNIVIGRSRFSVPVGRTRVVRVRLNRKGRRLVRKAGGRGLKVKLRGNGVANRNVRLKEKRKKKKGGFGS